LGYTILLNTLPSIIHNTTLTVFNVTKNWRLTIQRRSADRFI